jgi:pimeloyl-ACP methyl ester carboxylesterase
MSFMFLIILSANVSAQNIFSQSDVLYNVTLRPNVTVNMHATILQRRGFSIGNRTILAVHGLSHTGNAMIPLASEILKKDFTVSRIVLIDLPGRNGSSVPTNLLFGNLVMDDYVTSIIGTLNFMKARKMPASTIVAHSMGSILVELVQQRLQTEGTNLKNKYGVNLFLAITSSIPNPLPWYLADSGNAGQLAGQFITASPELGQYVSIPPEGWISLFFTNLSGVVVPGALSANDIISKKYNANEPLLSTLQLLGIAGFQRPYVSQNIFNKANGTFMILAAMSQDTTVSVEEARALYRYLTGDKNEYGFAVVTEDDAVHDMLISKPRLLLKDLTTDLLKF